MSQYSLQHARNHWQTYGRGVGPSRLLGARGNAQRQIELAYAAGFSGCFNTRSGPAWCRDLAAYDRDQLREALGKYRAAEVIPSAFQGTAAGKRACHWNHILAINPLALSGSQDYGNCTSWMTREGVEHTLGVDIAVKGDLHEYRGRTGTAVTYGSRQSSGQGMTLSRAMWAIQNFGIAQEKVYCDGKYDLSTEDADEAAGNRWGRSGPPEDLLTEIKGDRIATVVEISTTAEAMDALYGGAACGHGSTLTGTTKGTLISGLTSIGGHAQALLGYDDTDEFRQWYEQTAGERITGPVFINDQSWGANWNAFRADLWPSHLWGERPEGAWVLAESDMQKVISQWGDAYAWSNVEGLVRDGIPDWSEAFEVWA